MAARGQDLNVRITATDTASKVVDGVSKKVGKLEDDPHVVDLDADDDKAVTTIKALDSRLDGLTAEEREFVLKAQAKQLEREVDGALKKLSRLDRYDDEEITLILEAKDKASAELKTVRDELGKVEDAAGDANEAVGEIGEGQTASLGSRFKGLGSTLGTKLVAGFAAIGVGKLLSDAIVKGMDIRQGVKALTGQFRISADDAEKYGKIAGDLYAANWGDSLREVQLNVATTAQRLGEITDAELASVSEGILAITSTWEASFDETVRAVSQLMQNDLAPTATEALGLVTAAFQGGGDEAGDLLDTIIEYSQHWSNFGLSGEEAIGMIISGFQNGQRDADKMGDAVKEMFLRTSEQTDEVDAAFANLGINVDEWRRRVMRGGDDARDAYNEVIQALIDGGDQTVKNGDAVVILGTQFEDMAGLKALPSLLAIEGKIGDVDTAVKDLTTSIEATPIEIWARRGETGLNWVGEAALIAEGHVTEFGQSAGEAAEKLRPWSDPQWKKDIYGVGDALESSAVAFELLDTAMFDGLSTFEEVKQAVIDLTGDEEAALIAASQWRAEQIKVTEAEKEAAEAADEHASKLIAERRAAIDAGPSLADLRQEAEDLAESQMEAREAAIDHARALEDLKEKAIDLVGGDIALRESQRRTKEALEEYTEEIKGAKEGTDEYQQIVDGAATSVLAGAEAAVQYAIDQAAANGETLNASEKSAIMVEELGRVAATLAPDSPLRAQLQGYREELMQIPTSINTVLSVSGQTVTAGGDIIGAAHSTMSGARADGGPVSGGKTYLVGEEGPELFTAPGSGQIIPNDKLSSGGGMMDTDALAAAVAQGMRDGWRSIRLTERAT